MARKPGKKYQAALKQVEAKEYPLDQAVPLLQKIKFAKFDETVEVHLRLGVVLGPGPGALAAMLPLFRLGLGGRLGNGRQWMSWISLPDAVAATLFVLRTPALAGPVNLTAPNPVTNAQLTRALARALRRPAILPPPAFALRLALGPMADEALLASARVFPSRLLTSGFRFEHPTVAQALAAALQ